jgi:hypothetical protein
LAAVSMSCGSSDEHNLTPVTGGAAGAGGAVGGAAGAGGAAVGGAAGAGGAAGDATVVDLCAGPVVTAAAKKLCNGAIPGPGAASASGGTCDDNVPCGASLICMRVASGLPGMCVPTCMPADTEFSTGTCASGYRCVTMSSTEAYCFPSCNSAADCASSVCKATSGVCLPPVGGGDSGAGGGPGTDGSPGDGAAGASGDATAGSSGAGGDATAGSGGAGGVVEGGPDVVVTDTGVKDVAADSVQDVVLQNPILQNPVLQNPVLQNPVLKNPVLQNPVLRNPVLLNPIVKLL